MGNPDISGRLEWGPKPLVEIFLALDDSGQIFYQFTGLNGGNADPNIVLNMLQLMGNAIIKGIQESHPGVVMDNVTELKGAQG